MSSPEETTSSKRETLTSRAKRIIGRALDAPPKEAKSSSTKGGPPKKSPTKRREQVLQAQRAHRQRTQGYIRELEKEVLRLRDREEDYLRKNETLTEKVTTLEQHILTSNILFPDEYELVKTELDQGVSTVHTPSAFGSDDRAHSHTPGLANSDSEAGWSSGSIVGSMTPSAMVNIDLTQLSTLDPFRFEDYDVVDDDRPEFLPPESAKADLVSIPQLPVPRQTLNSQDGADFVLTLESFCLSHLKYRHMLDSTPGSSIPNSNFGSAHCYMATTNLIKHALPGDPSAAPFTVDVPDLEKLFMTSVSIDFGSDVTPIQIWVNLVRLSGLGYNIDKTALSLLADQMKGYIRCNGFGAVVERSTVDAIFHIYFPGQRYVESWKQA